MHGVLDWLTQLLSAYGYAALFGLLMLGIAGLPVPDETLLTFCGYLIFRGRLRWEFAWLAGFLGSGCGISISYWLGWRFGGELAGRFGKYVHLTEARLLQVERRFVRVGPILLTVGYFIPGVRHFTAIVAGMSGLPRRKFAMFAYLGAALWVSTFLTLGFVFGDSWQHSTEVVHRYVLTATGAIAVSLALVWGITAMRKRKA